MAIKFNNNPNPRGAKFGDEKVYEIKFGSTTSWVMPYGYSTGSLPTGVRSLVCNRISSKEPTANVGVVESGNDLYYGDEIYFTSIPESGYLAPTVKYTSDSPYTIPKIEENYGQYVIDGVTLSEVSTRKSSYDVRVTFNNRTADGSGLFAYTTRYGYTSHYATKQIDRGDYSTAFDTINYQNAFNVYYEYDDGDQTNEALLFSLNDSSSSKVVTVKTANKTGMGSPSVTLSGGVSKGNGSYTPSFVAHRNPAINNLSQLPTITSSTPGVTNIKVTSTILAPITWTFDYTIAHSGPVIARFNISYTYPGFNVEYSD